jgi:hypothetical protein
MTDWRMDDPPTGRIIEFETDTIGTLTGILHPAGAFGMGPNVRAALAKGERQYSMDGGNQFFSVRRWREVA